MKIINYIRFFKKIFVAKITKKNIPLIVILGVTNRCNFECGYCYGEHYRKGDRSDFTTKELLQIIRTLKSLGTEVIQLQGGEPLMRQDIKILVSEVKKLGMVCDMTTNGFFIPEKKDVVSLLDRICISLDGPVKTNDKNRGKGSFIRAIEGIEVACGLGIPVRISTVLTSETSQEDIDWLLGYALSQRKHCVQINFSPFFEFNPSFKNRKNNIYKVTNEHLKNLFLFIEDRKKKGMPIQFTAKSYALASNWPFSYQKKRVFLSDSVPKDFSFTDCYHGKVIFFIDGDGSLYPCCNFWGCPQFNIRTDGLKQSIFNLSRQNCQACYIPAYIDRNLFFKGVPGVWYNYFSQAIRRKL